MIYKQSCIPIKGDFDSSHVDREAGKAYFGLADVGRELAAALLLCFTLCRRKENFMIVFSQRFRTVSVAIALVQSLNSLHRYRSLTC